MIIIGIIGLLSSGKGTAAEYLVNKYKASHYGFSDALRDILQRLYIEENRQNLQNLSTLLRQEFGEDTLARTMAQDIKNDKADIIVVEGIRREADLKYLTDFPHFHLISIDADLETRYERLTKRLQNADDAKKTMGDFIKDNQKETEVLIPPLMLKAEFHINNNGSEAELYAQLDEAIEKIQGK
jgi:dephospho-CoA kinase